MDTIHHTNALAFAFEAVGGLSAAAKVCGRSYQALNKWRQTDRLPRTEYTGETQYAQHLAEAAKRNGVAFEAAWLLEKCKRSHLS
nr:helix-turn-helix domain-containing protein [Pseudomonas protegens]